MGNPHGFGPTEENAAFSIPPGGRAGTGQARPLRLSAYERAVFAGAGHDKPVPYGRGSLPELDRGVSAKTGRKVRIVAGALSAAPIGFAAGALLGGRYVVVEGGSAGSAILLAALVGAVLAAVAMASATAYLPPKPARIMTIAAGGISFAILVYMVRDFVVDRVEQSRAFDVAYARVPSFELTLTSADRQRRPFSTLAYEADRQSDTRDYEALRPGGWFCRGGGRRQDSLALYQGVRAAEKDDAADRPCYRRATWRVADEEPVTERCADKGDGFAALFAAADEMIDSTQRYASCRQASDLQSRNGAATIEG